MFFLSSDTAQRENPFSFRSESPKKAEAEKIVASALLFFFRLTVSGHTALFSELLLESLLLRKNHLAKSKRSGGYFKKLVIFYEFHALFKAQGGGWYKSECIVRARRTGVRQLLFLADVARYVLTLGTFADNHALIDRHAGTDKQAASVLRIEKTVARTFARLVDNNRASVSCLNVALVRLVAGKQLIHNAVAVGVGHKLTAVADQTSCGNSELKMRHAAVSRSHVFNLRFS